MAILRLFRILTVIVRALHYCISRGDRILFPDDFDALQNIVQPTLKI